jgi:hypothetical protein
MHAASGWKRAESRDWGLSIRRRLPQEPEDPLRFEWTGPIKLRFCNLFNHPESSLTESGIEIQLVSRNRRK